MSGLRWPRPQFSLRVMLLAWALPMPFIGWGINVKFVAVRQRAAMASLKERGYWVEKGQPPQPTWITTNMRKYVDADAFDQFSFVTWLRESDPKSEDINLLQQLPGLCDLRISHDSNVGAKVDVQLRNEDLMRLASIGSLTGVVVEGEYHPRAVLELSKLPHLQRLELPDTIFTDEALVQLGKKGKLTDLAFDASKLSEDALAQLQSATMLQTLCLRGLRKDRRILGGLSKCNTLTTLKLTESALSLDDADMITRFRIESLILVDCDIEYGFFAKLTPSQTIKRVYTTLGEQNQLVLELSPGYLAYCDDHFAFTKVSLKSAPREIAP